MGKPKQLAKEDLIFAVKQQLLREGQSKITLKNVAELAGVTQGALYYHFKTKDQLLISMLEDYLENSVSEETKRYRQHENRTDSLLAYLKETEYQTHIRSEQQQLLFELANLALHHREMKALMGEIMQRRSKEMESFFPEGEAQNGQILRAALDGLTLQSLFDPTFNAKDAFKQLIQIFTNKKEE